MEPLLKDEYGVPRLRGEGRARRHRGGLMSSEVKMTGQLMTTGEVDGRHGIVIHDAVDREGARIYFVLPESVRQLARYLHCEVEVIIRPIANR